MTNPWPTTPAGPLSIEGPVKQTAMVKSALASFDADVDPAKLLPKVVTVRFGDVINIPGTNKPAVGDTKNATLVRIRYGIPGYKALRPTTTEYTAIHESFGHGKLLQVPFTDDQKRRALKLIDQGVPLPAFNDPDEVWRQVKGELDYWLRPYEVLIDAMVEAMTALESPYRFNPTRPNAGSHYRRGVSDNNLPILKAIWLETPPAPPPPDPTPDPLPEPADPCADAVAVVAGQLEEERTAHGQTKAALADVESRLAAAKAKGAEIAAL